jgi:hypothetical protein
VWVWATNAERIAGTLAWFPTNVIMHFKSSIDTTIVATIIATNALCCPSPSSPIYPITKSQHDQLQQLADSMATPIIFKQHKYNIKDSGLYLPTHDERS